ncbi:metal tolerance protein 5-like isoform X2 [Panicum virgatum]|uniref:metal tolerance protein 5-like isoform X2 n=1 Tax=Panicum virgatum TaxID=38727 RepID=UPI0019D5FC2B|nr:metal tolerance protein 5-like isoform X2 [Panicum virgatum]
MAREMLASQGPEDVVAEYYQQQVEMLEGFNEMDTLTDRGFLPEMSKEEREKVARSETLAIRLSNIANMILFAAKVYASVRSGSLAIIASTLDSLLDLLSGFILWFTAFSMQTPNPYRYPIGKKRMQPLGILVFASVMATLGLQIILESMRSLVSDKDEFSLTSEQEKWVVDIMLSVTLVKLALVIYCRSFTNEIVKAYAQDHFFDVITNVIGLVAALLANYIEGWIDPVGAIIKEKPRLTVTLQWEYCIACNLHNQNMVDDGAGERALPGGAVGLARVPPEADVPVLEPPQGRAAHRHGARLHVWLPLLRGGGHRAAVRHATAGGARHR